MRKFGENRIIAAAGTFFAAFALTAGNYYRLAVQPPEDYVRAAAENSFITISAGDSQGTIYDRNMQPLVNSSEEYIAVAVPAALDREETSRYAADPDEFTAGFDSGEPFVFRCISDTPDSPGLTVFTLPVRYSEEQPAQHAVGYLSEGRGASGIEFAYDSMLRGGASENSVTYSIDGSGEVLIGSGKTVVRSHKQDTGVVTTLDSRIQKLCEDCGSSLSKGAIVVSDVTNGDILAIASFPTYSWNALDAALESEASPLIDRALYSYSVGSVFKLVTACEGLREGWSGGVYQCSGSIDVSGQIFHCHKYDGHGTQTMTEAIVNSCNTYFISLSRSFDVPKFRELAYSLGFGREIHLCSGMSGSAGVLPTVSELLVPAELANFSFGQGKLSATPLQINQLTAAIANGGQLTLLRLIEGITVDGETVGGEKLPIRTRVIDEETASELREMMIAAVRDKEDSNARPRRVSVGAKTSTAQTGRFGEDGEELCHGWITGFLPADTPRYAVTVLAEDGGYGNEAAAPVFRAIAEGLAEFDRKQLR